MYLIAINIEYRVIIGISAMVLLFTSFLIAFVISQRRKLQYHKDLRLLYNKQKQFLTEQNELLEEGVKQRTAELFQQKEELQSTLVNLRQAQAQLIQSEKMASMGELTAGIAHEIQNPLNFVNNFSEVNTELIQELEEEAAKGNIEEVMAIAKDVKDNEQKINQHGKRAGAIVRAMLQHTRLGTGKGQKEPVDINALVDECWRLSYHSFKAKNPQGGTGVVFDVNIQTAYDSSLSAGNDEEGKINVVLQDISRVLLNVFNNAFYAVKSAHHLKGKHYEPTIWVSTKRSNSCVSIMVRDNGSGIPQNIIDKIFQPFFTTKPTGQGTGLGLSLSYDIIKAHGGEIRVDSKEGEGTCFVIILNSEQ